jgi:hypothetical protein
MADRIGALIEYLEAWPALAGVPVVAPRLNNRLAKLMPADCVVLTQMGGFGDLQGIGLYHQRIVITAYGKTAQGADALHEKCMQALNNLDNYYSTAKDVMLCNADLESGSLDDIDTTGTTGTNSRQDWPYVESTWGIMVIFD